MNKKRLIVYAAIVLAFALACTAHFLPNIRVWAYTYAPAEIGTATLQDAGDTVFIRTAKFTVDGEEIVASGFTVGNAAPGDDPAAAVNMDVLTPITHANAFAGTLDKDIYFCDLEGRTADLYLGDLKLAEGRRIYTNGGNINLLGGSLEVDAIQTAGNILIGSASVTVNGDLTGFKGINVYTSTEAFGGAEAYTPGSLTVNGNMTNTDEYQSGTHVTVMVNGGSSLTVTGDVNMVYGIDVNSTGDPYGKSVLTVGGSVTLTDNNASLALMNATAQITGDINAAMLVTAYKDSYLKAGSVTTGYFAALSNSVVEIEGDVAVSSTLDINNASGGQAYNFGGNITCQTFCAEGASADDPIAVNLAGDAKCVMFSVLNAVLDFDGDITQTGSPFLFNHTTADIAGDVSGANLDFDNSNVTIHGDVSSQLAMPVRNTNLLVEGDVTASRFNPIYSTVTINGNLTNSGTFVLNYGSKVTIKGNLDNKGNDIDVVSGSQLEIEGDTVNDAAIKVLEGSNLTTLGSYTGSRYFTVHKSEATIGKDVYLGGNFDVNHSGKLTVKGNAQSGYVSICDGGDLIIEGDLYPLGEIPIHYATLTVGGDLTFRNDPPGVTWPASTHLDVLENSTCTVGGSVTNASVIGVTSRYNASKPSVLTVGGDAQANTFITVCPCGTMNIGGDLSYYSAGSLIEGKVIVGGDLINTATGDENYYYYRGLRVNSNGYLEVGGDVRMDRLILNPDDYEKCLKVDGIISAYRITNIKRTVSGEYLIEGEPPKIVSGSEYGYCIPFEAQFAEFTIDGEPYVIDARDRTKKSFDPIKVTDKYSVVFEMGEDAGFKELAVITDEFYTETGVNLPEKKDVLAPVGFLFDGWYDNPGLEGDPITVIPAGAGEDVTVYAKYTVCDHEGYDMTPTCTEPAVCPACRFAVPATGHSYEVSWDWTDEATVSVTFTCAEGDYEETFVIESDSITSEVAQPAGAATDGTERYTASFEFEGETYTGTYDKIIPATGEPDTGDDDTPAEPCPYCGEIHDSNTLPGFIISYLHDLIFVIWKLTFGVAIYLVS